MKTYPPILLGLLALLLPLSAAASDGAAPASPAEGNSLIVALSAGQDHSCSLRGDGGAICWGRNDAGQALPTTPTEVAKLDGPFLSLTAGASHTCGLKPNGVVACWGSNTFGQASPPTGSSNGGFVQLGAGSDFTCARKSDGSVLCWGNYQRTSPPGAGRQFIDLAVGTTHACALMANGNAYCWGSNATGEAPGYTSTQPSVAGPFLSLVAGNAFSCGLAADGQPQCWGAGISGTPPVGPFVSLAAGYTHACALRVDGSASCWGSNGAGQAPPIAPAGPHIALAAGGSHTCGLQANGTVNCWGSDTDSQASVPTGVGEAAFGQIAAGNAHVCQVRRDGGLGCWGRNLDGQATPPAGRYVRVAAGDALSCGIDVAGVIVCWGADGVNTSAAFSGTKWRQLSMGQSGGLCALRETSDLVRCRTLGGVVTDRAGRRYDSAYNYFNAPVRTLTYVSTPAGNFCAPLMTDSNGGTPSTYNNNYCVGISSYVGGRWQSVESGLQHTCALQASGFLQCFGAFSEQTTIPYPYNGYKFRAVSVGSNHSCAIRDDGTLYCWGDAANGKLNAPVGTFSQVAAGNTFNCAIRSNGTRMCWGDNAAGQAPQVSLLPAIVPTEATVGIAYPSVSFSLVVTNGSYVPSTPAFAAVQGALPPGLTLNPAGVLSGTPTAGGNFSFTVEGEDANGFAARGSYTIAIPVPPDDTPPIVSATLTPATPDGSNGWYVSDVGIHWAVSDPESGIASSSGCNSSAVTSDTTAASATCSATNGAGLEMAVTLAPPIKRDATPPTISAAATTSPNANGWHSGDVTVHFSCSDSTSGVASCPADQVLTSSGSSAAKTIMDNAGNQATSNVVAVSIDRSAPVISYTLSPASADGSNGWYTGTVLVQWTVTDPESGIASSTGCNDSTLASDTASASYTCSATNAAGQASSLTTSSIKRDATPPTLAPIVPDPLLRGGSYVASPNASDALSGVGIASCGPLDTSSTGDKSVDCTAADNAGNSRTVALAYTVTTTCANEGYTGASLTWCRNVCEMGYTGATLDTWIHRWVNRYRDLPYCLVNPQPNPQLTLQ